MELQEKFNRMLVEHSDEAMEFFDPSPASPGRAMGEFVDLGYQLPEWPYTITPQVLSRDGVDLLQRGVESVMAGTDYLIRDTFHDDFGKLAEVLRLEQWQVPLSRIARHQDWARIARPDVIWTGGAPSLIEVNASTWLGGLGESDLLVRALTGWPRAEHFLDEAGIRPLDTMTALAAHIRSAGRLRPDDLVVVAYWADGHDNMPPVFRRALESQFRRGGLNAVVAPIEELDLDGEHITLDGKRVTALYRFFEEVDAVHSKRTIRWRRLLDHIASERVILIGDFVGDLFANKALLGLLSEAADGGTVPARIASGVRKILPWTRLLADTRTTLDGDSIDLLDHCSRHRESLVLKPADGYGGADVAFGANMSQHAWTRTIDHALSDSRWWVVQRFAAPPVERLASFHDGQMRLHPARSVTGAFFVGRRYAGGIRRWAHTQESGEGELNINPVFGAGEGSVFSARQYPS